MDLLCNNGEGGELPDLIGKYPRNRGQQIASGRFGVSALLANSSDYLEIKIGQGAKPGEGGHLPARKVSAKVALARNAKPGIDLISPSNNHDIYSIEDLAQVVHELKTVNPRARVAVKVPVVPDIGVIAVGVAKSGADIVTLSGYDGGTGAARQHALRRAGLPAEIGVALDDLAAHGAVDIGRGLDRLDDRHGLAGRDATPRFGRLDEHEVAERLLRVIGDADRDRAVALEPRPLVAFQEAKIVRDFAHGALRKIRFTAISRSCRYARTAVARHVRAAGARESRPRSDQSSRPVRVRDLSTSRWSARRCRS
jgi:hypothetical protein